MMRRAATGRISASLFTLGMLWVAIGVIWHLTAGLTIFTSEAWRRAAVASEPRPIPSIGLEDELGRRFHVDELCGRVLVVDFIYTQCPTICKSLGATSSQLARRLAEDSDTADAIVLSVSFDPTRDTPARLLAFRSAMEKVASPWRLARPTDVEALRTMLDSFGVVAIADGLGGYEHNAALHVVDHQCRLARIVDADDIEAAAAAARQISLRLGA